MNLFKARALDFIYCNSYIPEIDDSLSGYEYQRNKMFWGSPFDVIIIPIGLYLLHKEATADNSDFKTAKPK